MFRYGFQILAVFFFLALHTGASYGDPHTCWGDITCHGYGEVLHCEEEAQCIGVGGTVRCSDNAICRGYWAEMYCEDESVCTSYGTEKPQCENPAHCIHVDITDPTDGQVADLMKASSSALLQTVTGCAAAPGHFAFLPQGECTFSTAQTAETEAALKTLFDSDIYTCSGVSPVTCKLRNEDGYVQLYGLLMTTLQDPPTNEKMAQVIRDSGSVLLKQVTKCAPGSFPDHSVHPAYACLFSGKNVPGIQTALNSYLNFHSYHCSLSSGTDNTVCTATSKLGLEMAYFKVNNLPNTNQH